MGDDLISDCPDAVHTNREKLRYVQTESDGNLVQSHILRAFYSKNPRVARTYYLWQPSLKEVEATFN
jgi:hypothetical protein